ncbi:hypothetical protein [Enterovibrio coralii]|uniref:hypothetical protein n=1 Tax=Enterovibrio coralii TaxID=294935 RepID=UPI000AB66B83|nr:hypothetical protein [Enterovibrio coralii]
MKSFCRCFLLVIFSGFLAACGGGGGGDDSNSGSASPTTSTLTVFTGDSVTSAPLISATVTINNESKQTDNAGKTQFTLAQGQYSVSVGREGYNGLSRVVSVGAQSQQVSMLLSKSGSTQIPPKEETNERKYVFHSDFAPSYEFEHQGSTWGSGATTEWDPEGSQFSTSLLVTSGSNWGPFAVAAWGNEAENAIDTKGFDLLRFKYKSDFATEVEVSIQGVNSTESKIIYSLGTALSLGNDWYEMEVPFPGFADLTWIGSCLLVTARLKLLTFISLIPRKKHSSPLTVQAMWPIRLTQTVIAAPLIMVSGSPMPAWSSRVCRHVTTLGRRRDCFHKLSQS